MAPLVTAATTSATATGSSPPAGADQSERRLRDVGARLNGEYRRSISCRGPCAGVAGQRPYERSSLRVLRALLLTVLLLGVAACGGSDSTDSTDTADTPAGDAVGIVEEGGDSTVEEGGDSGYDYLSQVELGSIGRELRALAGFDGTSQRSIALIEEASGSSSSLELTWAGLDDANGDGFDDDGRVSVAAATATGETVTACFIVPDDSSTLATVTKGAC